MTTVDDRQLIARAALMRRLIRAGIVEPMDGLALTVAPSDELAKRLASGEGRKRFRNELRRVRV